MPRLSTAGQGPPSDPSPAARSPRRLRLQHTPRTAPRRVPPHAARAAWLIAALCLLVAAPGAWAQSVTLVSNIGQADGGVAGNDDFAQTFTTGAVGLGYTLTGVDINLFGVVENALASVTVSIYSESSDLPDASLGTLTYSGTQQMGSGEYSFAHAGINLEKGTTYFVVMDKSADIGFTVRNTNSNEEDADKADGWSISDESLRRNWDATSWISHVSSKEIRIRGTVNTDTTAPSVTSIVRHDPTSFWTNADSLTWRVTFSGDVKNVDATDFGLDGTTATLTVAAVMGSSSVYDVTASGGDLAGRNSWVRLTFASAQDIADTSDNAFASHLVTGTRQPTYSVDNTAPAFSTAAVRGTSLVVTFNEDLAAANLANAAFEVKKTPNGGSEETVSLSGIPSISGAAVTLTLAAAVVAADTVVTVSYTRPTSGSDNTLKDLAGNEAASFADEAVTNNANVAATGAPAVVGNAQVGRTLTVLRGDIADANGLPVTRFPTGYTFQWMRVDADGTSNLTDIAGETGQTYTLAAADQGKKVKVGVAFTDRDE